MGILDCYTDRGARHGNAAGCLQSDRGKGTAYAELVLDGNGDHGGRQGRKNSFSRLPAMRHKAGVLCPIDMLMPHPVFSSLFFANIR